MNFPRQSTDNSALEKQQPTEKFDERCSAWPVLGANYFTGWVGVFMHSVATL